MPQLRTALADYLNRVRGTLAHPDHIVISTGYAQGVTLLIGVLAASGAKRLALEDPSSVDDALPAARAAGLEVVGIPVDRDGISAGLHLVTWLPPHLDETAVVEMARRAGVGIDAVGPYRIGHPGPGGLIFGYATVSEQAIAEGVARLAGVIGKL